MSNVTEDFVLTFSVDTAAFRNEDESVDHLAVSETVRQVADQIVADARHPFGRVRDANGNHVGHWHIRRLPEEN